MGNTRARIYVFAAKVSIKLSPGIKQLSGGELAIIAQRAGGRTGVLKTDADAPLAFSLPA